MEYTMTERIYDLTFGKIDNYIATKKSPKYIEMVRAEIKKSIIIKYRQYLKLEKSLSANTVEAYLTDLANLIYLEKKLSQIIKH